MSLWYWNCNVSLKTHWVVAQYPWRGEQERGWEEKGKRRQEIIQNTSSVLRHAQRASSHTEMQFIGVGLGIRHILGPYWSTGHRHRQLDCQSGNRTPPIKIQFPCSVHAWIVHHPSTVQTEIRPPSARKLNGKGRKPSTSALIEVHPWGPKTKCATHNPVWTFMRSTLDLLNPLPNLRALPSYRVVLE